MTVAILSKSIKLLFVVTYPVRSSSPSVTPHYTASPLLVDCVSFLEAPVTVLPQPLLSLYPPQQLLSIQIKGWRKSASRHFTLQYFLWVQNPKSPLWFVNSHTTEVGVHSRGREDHILVLVYSILGPQEPSVTQMLFTAIEKEKRNPTNASGCQCHLGFQQEFDAFNNLFFVSALPCGLSAAL